MSRAQLRLLIWLGSACLVAAAVWAWQRAESASETAWTQRERARVLDAVEAHFSALTDGVDPFQEVLGEIPAHDVSEEALQLQAVFGRERYVPGAQIEVYRTEGEAVTRTLLVSAETIQRTGAGELPNAIRMGAYEELSAHLEEDPHLVDDLGSWIWFSSSASGVHLHVVRLVRGEPEDTEEEEHEGDEEDHEEEEEEAAELDPEQVLLLAFRTPVDGIETVHLEVLCDLVDGAIVPRPGFQVLPHGLPAAQADTASLLLEPDALFGQRPARQEGPLLRARLTAGPTPTPWPLLLVGLGIVLLGAGLLWRRPTTAEDPTPVDLSSEAAHEMRTPLTVMRGKLEVALRRDRDPEAYQRVLRDCLAEVDALEHLQDAILLLARTDASHLVRETVDLVDLVQAELSRVGEAAPERQVVLEADHPDSLPVEGDPSLLARAIGNLLDNAAHYSVPAGDIRVSLSRSGGDAILVVEDDGPGIPRERRQRVFDRFYRGPEVGRRGLSGCGLGLPIVARIAELHGGDITLDDRVMNRCRFVLRIARG